MEPMTRREALKAGALSSLAVGTAGFISACGGSSGATASATAGAPRRGGSLRVGVTGGSSTDTVDPLNPVNNADFARVGSLYNQLAVINALGHPELSLAEEITPNTDATLWTIRLKSG